jgi:hypothetical protein
MEYIFLVPIWLGCAVVWRCFHSLVESSDKQDARKLVWRSIFAGAVMVASVISCGRLIGHPSSLVVSPLRYELFQAQIAFAIGSLMVATLAESRVSRQQQESEQGRQDTTSE